MHISIFNRAFWKQLTTSAHSSSHAGLSKTISSYFCSSRFQRSQADTFSLLCWPSTVMWFGGVSLHVAASVGHSSRWPYVAATGKCMVSWGEVFSYTLPLEVPYDHIFQGAVTLANILWLYLTGSEEVTEVALKLVLKVGKSVYQLNASPSSISISILTL